MIMYKRTTQVPNIIFDKYLPNLKESELKILLIIIRQTYGWVNTKTGKRKTRDRITQSQFIKKTGLSRRVISKTIKSLVEKKLIIASDFERKELYDSIDRKGKSYIFYSFHPVHILTLTCAQSTPEPVHNSAYNKTNYTKEKKTKLREKNSRRKGGVVSVGEVMNSMSY